MALPQPPVPQTATCFRHPGREAGRRCTRCGSRPAPTASCRRPSAATASSAPSRTGRPWRPRSATGAPVSRSLVTYTHHRPQRRGVHLAGDPGHRHRSSSSNTQAQGPSSISASPGPLIDRGSGEWYRLVTSGFLHFGIIHIAFNMLLLFQLGQLLEPAIGRIRFGLLYFAALLGGSAGALILSAERRCHGGASGAVFGLMAAAFVGLRNRGVNPFSTGIGTRAGDQPRPDVRDPRHLDRRPPRRHRRRCRSPAT